MKSSASLSAFPYKKLLLSACILQASWAQAQEVVQLAPITLEATRTDTSWLETPASVYRIEQPQNQNNLDVNLSETLKGVPGLQINNRENYAQDLQISMRGFGARSTFGVRGIRLYVDGIPATMPDGQGQTSNIDLGSLDHIEVLSGPFSSLYGNSSGGTILSTTREGKGRDSVELGYAGGSHHKNKTSLVLQGGADKAGEPSYIISSSYFDTDGFREHSAARKVLNNAKLSWNLEDGSQVNWVVNHVDINADDPGGLTRQQWKDDPRQQASFIRQFDTRKEIQQTQTGVTWSKPINDQHELYGMAYLGQRHVIQYQSIPNTAQANPRHAGGVIDFERMYYGTDLRWTGKELLPNTTLSIGMALDAMDEDRQGYENFVLNNNTPQYGVKGNLRRDEKNTLWNIDPYIQASWQFLPDWRVDSGLRYSNVHYESKDKYIKGPNEDDSGQTDYQKLLPSIALSWNIRPDSTLYISYAKGFETPTFTEMAYPTLGTSGINFDLKPASSDSYELGFKTQNNWGDFSTAIFHTQTRNDIVSAESNNGRNTFQNAKRTQREGIELYWNKNLWRELYAQASYSYLNAKFDADIPGSDSRETVYKGNIIPGIAKNQAYIALNWQPETGFQAGLDVRYNDKIYVDDINSDTAPSYTVMAANIGYVWKNADWKINTFARVDNLLDKDYVGSVIVNDGNKRFFEPADGRNWSAGLKMIRSF